MNDHPFPPPTGDRQDRIVVLIPCYQEAASIGRLVGEVVAQGFEALVVDDGSTDSTAEVARSSGATVLRQERNQGKGSAIKIGLRHAHGQGYAAAILMDGDGQHLPAELSRFAEAFRTTGADCIVGTRMAHPDGMPFVRRLTNRLMSGVLSRIIGQRLSDTQCGYRLIARDAMPDAIDCDSSGFAADSEIILQLADRGFVLSEVPVSSVYGSERSKIRPVRDTWRFVRMLSRHNRRNRNKPQPTHARTSPH